MLDSERQAARSLVRQLIVYATGAPVRFGDRVQVETIMERTKSNAYAVRSIVREIVQSDLFRSK